MENLKSNQQRAKYAITLIWIVLFMEIIALFSGYLQYDLLQIVNEGGEISDETATANDLREQIVGIVYMCVYIISIITFIKWFRRAYYNLHLKVTYLSHTEGWAAGAWFIPILNLYRPYQIMKELYQVSKNILNNRGLITNSMSSTGSLGLWWTLWLASSFLGQIDFRYTLRAETLDQLINSTIMSMVGNIISIPLCLITIKVISDYSHLEQQLYELKDEDVVEEQLVLTW
jgi:hypothetical protein